MPLRAAAAGPSSGAPRARPRPRGRRQQLRREAARTAGRSAPVPGGRPGALQPVPFPPRATRGLRPARGRPRGLQPARPRRALDHPAVAEIARRLEPGPRPGDAALVDPAGRGRDPEWSTATGSARTRDLRLQPLREDMRALEPSTAPAAPAVRAERSPTGVALFLADLRYPARSRRESRASRARRRHGPLPPRPPESPSQPGARPCPPHP